MASWWALATGVGLVLTLLLMGAWFAGREAGGLEAQRLNVRLSQLEEQLSADRLRFDRQSEEMDRLRHALDTSGKQEHADTDSRLRQRLSIALAEANEYKQILEREKLAALENSPLLDALSKPGARLLTLKASDAAAGSTAYGLLSGNSQLLFVASHLPSLEDGRQFQLWVIRKEEPKIASAGVFAPDDDQNAFLNVNDSSVLSDVVQLAVTAEPEGGSSAPTGAKLLESASSTAEPTGVPRSSEDQRNKSSN